MPRQNRVNPFGELIATSARGLYMGNRGNLHDAAGNLAARRWQVKRWITCLTQFQNIKRPLMAPGCYTELFFLDEATALAAGHRPCCECRREDFKRFKTAWLKGNSRFGFGAFISADDLDKKLHEDRVDQDKRQTTFKEKLGNLPDGVMVARGDQSWLIWEGSLWLWSPGGYSQKTILDPKAEMDVLTPRSTCNAIAAGYVPQVAVMLS